MEGEAAIQPSPFLHQSRNTAADSLTILHLRRDTQFPLILRQHDEDNEGYSEGKVINTRFGSFPHTTLIGVPFGTQIRASKVDTGSRGRRKPSEIQSVSQKRKRALETPMGSSPRESGDSDASPAPVAAAPGFGHVFPPTPERWTASLPHRTQVVYTHDYSYILQRLRARPGSVIIEAGGGSGSFTHAAARAVFNDYPSGPDDLEGKGRVWTFECDPDRAVSIQGDLVAHGLTSLVTLTHRDVYADGFAVTDPATGASRVCASVVFLDLPAPWRALPHLDRDLAASPLDPRRTVHLCTFSPCIEQVQRTVAVLRARGWAEIGMVELASARLESRRERIGLQEEGLHGVQATPATVDEALGRLRELADRARMHQLPDDNPEKLRVEADTKQVRLNAIRAAQTSRRLYEAGRLVHRSEGEIKTHTSYLVFAVMPMSWSAADEAAAAARTADLQSPVAQKSKKQMKREAREARAAAQA